MANERSPSQSPTDATIVKTCIRVFSNLFGELSSSVHNMIRTQRTETAIVAFGVIRVKCQQVSQLQALKKMSDSD